jgi:serine/threonine protein kinase
LDSSFNAKVSDFGLAVALEEGGLLKDDVQVQGTFGYIAPEYLMDGTLTEKSDVYGFGVVLLELLTGRLPIDMSLPLGSQSLVTWVTPLLTKRSMLMEILDPSLRESVNEKHLHQVAAVAVLCVQAEASYRPLIADVVQSLLPLVPQELGGAFKTKPKAETNNTAPDFIDVELQSFHSQTSDYSDDQAQSDNSSLGRSRSWEEYLE